MTPQVRADELRLFMILPSCPIPKTGCRLSLPGQLLLGLPAAYQNR